MDKLNSSVMGAPNQLSIKIYNSNSQSLLEFLETKKLNCKQIAILKKSAPEFSFEPKRYTEIDLKLMYAAFCGNEVGIRLCHEWKASELDIALAFAAFNGHKNLVLLLHSWGATKNNENAFVMATKNGQIDMMELLYKWGASKINTALYAAAESGHIKAIQLLRDWGATGFDLALKYAAGNGHHETMQLLYDFAPACSTSVSQNAPVGLRQKIFDYAMIDAAKGGHIKAMRLLKKWGVSQFDFAFDSAVQYGHIKAIKLLRSWGINNLDYAFNLIAKDPYHIEILCLLHELGATNLNQALRSASYNGNLKAMCLLKEWGATDFNGALYCAVSFIHIMMNTIITQKNAVICKFLLENDYRLGAMQLLCGWGAANYVEYFNDIVKVILATLHHLKLREEAEIDHILSSTTQQLGAMQFLYQTDILNPITNCEAIHLLNTWSTLFIKRFYEEQEL